MGCRFLASGHHHCHRRDGRLVPEDQCWEEARAQVDDEVRLKGEVDALGRELARHMHPSAASIDEAFAAVFGGGA